MICYWSVWDMSAWADHPDVDSVALSAIRHLEAESRIATVGEKHRAQMICTRDVGGKD